MARHGAERSYGGASGEERRTERRARFVAAGIACFGREGFRATTTRSLCAEAELTQRYFYESFRDLEHLFTEVCVELRGRVRSALERAMERAGPGPEAVLRAALSAYFRGVRQNPAATRILLIEAFAASGRGELEAHRFMEELGQLFRSRLFPPAARAEPGIDTRVLSVGLVGAVHHMSLCWALGQYREPLDVMIESACLPFRPLFLRTRGSGP